jgi:hypothetical protein
MDARGPQPVQFRNGYRYRRSAGSNSSRRQAAQVARSGGSSRDPPVPEVLCRTANPGPSRPVPGRIETWSTRACSGAWARSLVTKSVSAGGLAASRITTAPPSLRTSPSSPSSVARRYTNGRNPTPCTVPRTVTSDPARLTLIAST